MSFNLKVIKCREAATKHQLIIFFLRIIKKFIKKILITILNQYINNIYLNLAR